jgi:hypothetical protein
MAVVSFINKMQRLLILSSLILLLTPCAAQNFETFVKSLDKVSIAKRGTMVKQYLDKVPSTPIVEGRQKVHFVWFGKADTVRVEGELQTSWAIPKVMTVVDCGDEDLFYYSYTIPADAFFEYRFIINKQRKLDPKNKRVAQGFDFTDRNFFAIHQKTIWDYKR